MVHKSEQSASSTQEALSEGLHGQHAASALTVAIRRVLAGFTLDIAFSVPGGLTVLFGPSGAGKSLTLQAMAGLFPLDSASIALSNTVWHDSAHGFFLPPQRRRVGYVPQTYALFPHLTVEQNIAFGLKAHGGKVRERVSELIRLMQLEGLERRWPAQLSGGQQQRVALARALAPDPHLLLLDEPFSSLDAAVRETLREELRALHEHIHMPIVLVTHDAAEACALAETIVVIQQGRVLQVGTPDEVFRSPQTPTIAALVGMDTRWSGSVSALAPAPHLLHSEAEQQVITLQTDGLALHALLPASWQVRSGQTLELGLRANEIRLFSGEQEGINEREQLLTCVPGTVRRDLPKGAYHRITVQLETGHTLTIPMIAREMQSIGIQRGSSVIVGIPASAVHVFRSEERTSLNTPIAEPPRKLSSSPEQLAQHP